MSEVLIDAELLTCPICADTFVDACSTGCGHTFCEFCLNSCLETRPDKCPVCSKEPSPVHPCFTIRSLCSIIADHVVEDETMTVESEKELGNASYYKNKYAQAIVHYNNAINKCTHSADPKNSYLYNNRSQCFIHLRQYKRALEDCEEAIRLNPSNVKAYMRKGLCLRQLGQLEESRNAYNQATAYDTAKEWTQQITDGLMALPVFSNRPQQPQQQQQGRPNVQQQQQQRPPQQQQQQQARPQSQPPQQQNHQQQYYIPQQGQYNAYPQFNPQHARYQYPGNYTVRSTGQYQPNVNYYAQPPTQYPTNTNVNNNNNAPRPQQPPPQQPPTTTTTSTTAPPPAPPPQQNNPTVAATSTTSSASSTSTTTSASTNAASSSGRRSRSSSDVHEKKNCKNQ